MGYRANVFSISLPLELLAFALCPVSYVTSPNIVVHPKINFRNSELHLAHGLRDFLFLTTYFLGVTDKDTNRCKSVDTREHLHMQIREEVMLQSVEQHRLKCGTGPQANSFHYTSRDYFLIAHYAFLGQSP